MKAGKMCEIATNVFAYAFGRDEWWSVSLLYDVCVCVFFFHIAYIMAVKMMMVVIFILPYLLQTHDFNSIARHVFNS